MPGASLREHVLDRSVKFHALRHRQAAGLAADDAQPGAAEHVDDGAGARGLLPPAVGLDDGEGLLDLLGMVVGADVGEQRRLGPGVLGPQAQVLGGVLRIVGGEHARLEVADGAVGVPDHVAEGVADGLAGGVAAAEVADDAGDFGDGVLALEDEHEHAVAPAVGVGRQVAHHVVADQAAVLLVLGRQAGQHLRGIFFHQRPVRREHAGHHQFRRNPAEQARKHGAGAGLADGVRGDQDVGNLLGHKEFTLPKGLRTHAGGRAGTGVETRSGRNQIL